MDLIGHLRVFVEVARLGSFSAAARKLDLARDRVSKQIAALEAEVGTPLFARTTRSVVLTGAGEALFGRAEAVIAMTDEMLGEAHSLSAAPRGPLRVNAPMSFGQRYLAPLLASFHATYPKVQLRLDLNDRFIDPAKSGADVTLRIAQLPEQLDLVARPIATAPRWLVAAPAYLDAAGLPVHPSQLSGHACLHYGDAMTAPVWQFRQVEHAEQESPATVTVTARGPVCSNNGDVLLRAARDGLGLTVLPTFLLQEDLDAGRLRRVLPGWQVTPDIGMFALYSHAARSSPAVRAFVDFLGPMLHKALGTDGKP